MPFHPQQSLLRVDVPALRTVDTYSAEDLFGMWSLFSRTSNVMDEGKRLENLSWRLWNREALCCDARLPARSTSRSSRAFACDRQTPALSSSVESGSSEVSLEMAYTSKPRPELRRHDSCNTSSSPRIQKHITPDTLADMVATINQPRALEPLGPSPTVDLLNTPTAPGHQARQQPDSQPQQTQAEPVARQTEREQERSQSDSSIHAATSPGKSTSASQPTAIESSTSTFATDDASSQTAGSDSSSHTNMSTHSVIRGFAPSSYRSQTNLATQGSPAARSSSHYLAERAKKQSAKFTIGTSSGEDESSFEGHMYRSTLSQSLRAGSGDIRRNVTSAASNDIAAAVAAAAARVPEHSPVFESDDEDDEISESAIEDDDDDVDDDSSDWEDSDEQSRPSSVNEKELFQRVDSRPDLTSRRSLLTTLMHEPDRARALANAASRSTPALRRSRATTPNGPSVATSPETNAGRVGPTLPPGARPIIMTTSNIPPQLALSPRTTRRNMLSTELTESLRKNLLWERQHRSSGNLAALRRRHTSLDVRNLRNHPEPGSAVAQQHQQGLLQLSRPAGSGDFTNEYFNHGLQEYHSRGW